MSMTPTEKRLREALATLRMIASGNIGEAPSNDLVTWLSNWKTQAIGIADGAYKALAAIPSETGCTICYGNSLTADRIESLQAQLASLRERAVEECREALNHLGTGNADMFDVFSTLDKVLAKSPSVSGENGMKQLCGYCHAEFNCKADLDRHDDQIHGRRERLLSERNSLMNSFGYSSFADGWVRERIEEIDLMLDESK